MTRAQAIHQMRVAGWHEDTVALSILQSSTGISRAVAKQAFIDGHKMRLRGIRCGCNECAPKSTD
jgi:hypothetical protein